MMFSIGDRVLRSDVSGGSSPDYRDMRGTVVNPRGERRGKPRVWVQWDCDRVPCGCGDFYHCGATPMYPEAISKE